MMTDVQIGHKLYKNLERMPLDELERLEQLADRAADGFHARYCQNTYPRLHLYHHRMMDRVWVIRQAAAKVRFSS